MDEGRALADCALFDLDGTLVDSVDLHARSWTEALHYFGFAADYAEVRAQIGKGGDRLMPVFVPEKRLAEVEEALDSYRAELFRTRYRDQAQPIAGAAELLNLLRRRGKMIAIASSSKREDLEYYLRLLKIEQLIDAAIAGDEVEESKPAPDVFRTALVRLGARPEDAVAIGDSPWDALSASNAGVRTVGVRSGGFPDEDLTRAGVIAIHDDVGALARSLDGSPLA
jgi:HAD superfamily hydrolase (TIGR01509 family)